MPDFVQSMPAEECVNAPGKVNRLSFFGVVENANGVEFTGRRRHSLLGARCGSIRRIAAHGHNPLSFAIPPGTPRIRFGYIVDVNVFKIECVTLTKSGWIIDEPLRSVKLTRVSRRLIAALG